MKKKLLFFFVLVCAQQTYGQLACPNLTSPSNGAINVSVDATISWNDILGAPAYLISIGTTPNGTDILNNQNVGNATSYSPPVGLPENTDIYVTITIFFFNAENIECDSEMFRTESVTTRPNCTTPRYPIGGSDNVNVATSISWNYTPTATGYFLSLGTTPGGTDILDNENIDEALTYQPAVDFDNEAQIYVTIIPYNANGSALETCPEFSFTTGSMAIIPECASLISPANGAINVELSPVIQWTDIPDATGYRVTIGTTPFNANVLDRATFTQSSTVVVDFEPNLTFFITIVPFNAAGEALNCVQESFSTILGCGPYFDTITDQLVDLSPEISIRDTFYFCQNEIPFVVTSNDNVDGVRWFKLDQNDNEELVSSTTKIEISEAGRYRYEAYNNISQSGITIECENSKIINVVSSEIATIDALNVTGQNGTIAVTVQVSGMGDYEYAVDLIDGPYQDSNSFQNLQPGFHNFYVREKNGCGIAQDNIDQDISIEGFPKFFTPNGDGVNDFWQFKPSLDSNPIEIGTIDIFNRHGILLAQISPTAIGWDGSFKGSPLPSSDYWFKTVSLKNKKLQGHFTLKR